MDMSVLRVHCCTGDFRRFAPWFDLGWISNWDLIPDSTHSSWMIFGTWTDSLGFLPQARHRQL